ncbi:MAG: hypothetical protein U5N53_00475, partial [Mycobacterium sp.]|nr:hypothetical protein [Mycobacterium sp.]
MSAVRDGAIACPIAVVTGRGDPLFSFAYTQQGFTRIAAPAKELVVFDTDHHRPGAPRFDSPSGAGAGPADRSR